MAAVRPRQPHSNFEIHDDEAHEHENVQEDDQDTADEEEEIHEGEEYYEESSDEEEGPVDPMVQEDMDKFLTTFKGIERRFRLINRIGEGTMFLHFTQAEYFTYIFQVHSLQSIKPKISSTTNTTTTGILTREKIPNGVLHH